MNITSEAARGRLSAQITAATKRHIAPIFRVNPTDVLIRGSKGAIHDQGTITFVSYRGHCFGFTNQHVIGDLARPRADAALMLALRQHTPLPGRLIYISKPENVDFPYDVAVFLLDEQTIRTGGKEPIELTHQNCVVVENKRYLAAGYPGALRSEGSKSSKHPIYHIVTTAILASDRKLIFRDELSQSEELMRFGGISGGAIFDVGENDKYSIVGIIFEGRGQHEEVEARGSDTDIWIYGLPVCTTWFDHLLELAIASGSSLDLYRSQ